MRLVLFDIDGTLIDSHGFLTEVVRAAFEAEGLPVPDTESRRRTVGLSLPEALRLLSGLDGPALDALVARYRSLFHAAPPEADAEPLYPGARDVVETLSAQPQTILGIATGKGLRGVERVLGLHGLEAMFATCQTPDTNPSKPHPGMVLSAMAETGCVLERTAVVGDTTFDIEMAVAAGVAAIGVAWGNHPVADLRAAGAHAIVETFAELPPALDDLVSIDA